MTWVRLAMRWNGALAAAVAAAVPKRIAIDFELDEASQLQDMIGQVDQIVVDQTQRGQTRDVANLGQQLGEAVLVEIQCSKRTTHQVGRKPQQSATTQTHTSNARVRTLSHQHWAAA